MKFIGIHKLGRIKFKNRDSANQNKKIYLEKNCISKNE